MFFILYKRGDHLLQRQTKLIRKLTLLFFYLYLSTYTYIFLVFFLIAQSLILLKQPFGPLVFAYAPTFGIFNIADTKFWSSIFCIKQYYFTTRQIYPSIEFILQSFFVFIYISDNYKTVEKSL